MAKIRVHGKRYWILVFLIEDLLLI